MLYESEKLNQIEKKLTEDSDVLILRQIVTSLNNAIVGWEISREACYFSRADPSVEYNPENAHAELPKYYLRNRAESKEIKQEKETKESKQDKEVKKEDREWKHIAELPKHSSVNQSSPSMSPTGIASPNSGSSTPKLPSIRGSQSNPASTRTEITSSFPPPVVAKKREKEFPNSNYKAVPIKEIFSSSQSILSHQTSPRTQKALAYANKKKPPPVPTWHDGSTDEE